VISEQNMKLQQNHC